MLFVFVYMLPAPHLDFLASYSIYACILFVFSSYSKLSPLRKLGSPLTILRFKPTQLKFVIFRSCSVNTLFLFISFAFNLINHYHNGCL